MLSVSKFLLLSIPLVLFVSSAEAQSRIHRGAPTARELDRAASEMAKSDGLLQKGDIVVTDRGFLIFEGLDSEGIEGVFSDIPNPLHQAQPAPRFEKPARGGRLR